jgi:hypothetical protein
MKDRDEKCEAPVFHAPRLSSPTPERVDVVAMPMVSSVSLVAREQTNESIKKFRGSDKPS